MGTQLDWFKSSYSGNDDADCVEVAISHPTIHIRDSKNRDGARLAFTGGAWSEFLDTQSAQSAVSTAAMRDVVVASVRGDSLMTRVT
ncbi:MULTISPECIES: DUF397 domain-containing protein [Streptomyces]|uniref:DUF397 domain-containing protein n=1 Tax=Streptomyces koelreuteriae TaxID=2838015 RepID=A0ABX8FV38_9ACTN|nr:MULTISPECIES: DUF397 domain-containing protein [Streptomyces]QWB24974.1 DUF397 domain-containing protein [Streptomyces koelreuteriae]UUA07997.1 DUF397 domain-containing protein [Streptomyces koelreuteriae]UUA15626.1 DUF397 domain-containing protein [Streptomyces sp. CRCS-T-1]